MIQFVTPFVLHPKTPGPARAMIVFCSAFSRKETDDWAIFVWLGSASQVAGEIWGWVLEGGNDQWKNTGRECSDEVLSKVRIEEIGRMLTLFYLRLLARFHDPMNLHKFLRACTRCSDHVLNVRTIPT